MADIGVTLPLRDLLALVKALEENAEKDAEIQRLRREVEGLRNIQYECLQALGDLRRKINK